MYNYSFNFNFFLNMFFSRICLGRSKSSLVCSNHTNRSVCPRQCPQYPYTQRLETLMLNYLHSSKTVRYLLLSKYTVLFTSKVFSRQNLARDLGCVSTDAELGGVERAVNWPITVLEIPTPHKWKLCGWPIHEPLCSTPPSSASVETQP